MEAPVKFAISDPIKPPKDLTQEKWNERWKIEEVKWIELNKQINGNPAFSALTIKAAYVIGIIHQLCESITLLLKNPAIKIHAWLMYEISEDVWSTTYLPAYLLFASSIEIMGRCIRGELKEGRRSADSLKTGFKWLKCPYFKNTSLFSHNETIDDINPIITTKKAGYTLSDLVNLRNYSAHGQSGIIITEKYLTRDLELLAVLPILLADALETYWNLLQHDKEACHHLAYANISPFGGQPILKSWIIFESDQIGQHHSITEIFMDFDWKVEPEIITRTS
jgi:hypothetical protein